MVKKSHSRDPETIPVPRHVVEEAMTLACDAYRALDMLHLLVRCSARDPEHRPEIRPGLAVILHAIEMMLYSAQDELRPYADPQYQDPRFRM